ncbi:hypothetical protein [Arcticibacterium luteifluviistationis]|uniref:Uncharacterized protein n=1 Tax=Arcticibacterium luteifluviistationis TaxID=1784714 RepID=A0A2Z4GH00_9BACT|nr:hypothetical protein [Arcticibacterium luteifluviistationis]AWW00571.1 hypothetical protein DJ013_21235 [Arcticibacterium luteifluviistationis]
MKFKNNILEFTPTSLINILCEPFSVNIKLPQNQELKHISHYRIGHLYTDKGNTVRTMQVIDNAFDLELVTKDAEPKLIFGEHPPTNVLDHLKIPHAEFIPHYNCFGFCFANAQYRITDPSQILADEYEECTESESTVVVSFEKGNPVHAALRQNGKYTAKSGVKAMETFSTYHAALLGIPFDDFRFYRGIS